MPRPFSFTSNHSAMYYTYVLYAENYHKIYIGQTANLKQRLKTHNSIENDGWTARYQPWVLIYSEQFETRAEAMRREKALKSAKGRAFIWDLVHKKNNLE